MSMFHPLELLEVLRLDGGRSWGDVATPWQRNDASAILKHDPDHPRLHFLTRPRGGSKTTDTAAVALVILLTQAPPASVSLAYARDKDQAGLLLNAIRGLVQRSGPALSGLVTVGASWVEVTKTGARLQVESADAGSAFGHTPYVVVVDELAAWPSTRGAKDLWAAIVSGMPKRRNSRLIAITSAGDPAHWSRAILDAAKASPAWRVSEVPGPLPWVSEADLAEQRRLLLPSVYERLHLNCWTSGEDRLVSAADLAACADRRGWLEPVPGIRYVVGLDIGLRNDRTVVSVCHREDGDALSAGTSDADRGSRVILDRMLVLAGTRDDPVALADVEEVVLEASRAFWNAEVRADPWQAVGLCQSLRGKGITVHEWPFTAQSVGRLASNLHRLLRERALSLPADDAELLDELANVRLRTNSVGVTRLDHDAGGHDDRAVSLGLAALALSERPLLVGGLTNPNDYMEALGMRGRPTVGELAANAAPRTQPRAGGLDGLPPGVVVPSGGHGQTFIPGGVRPGISDPWGRRRGPRVDRGRWAGGGRR